MTAAIQAAIDVVYAAGGGDVIIPQGNYAVTSIVRVWAGPVSVNIRGAGKFATLLTKIGATTSPILDFSSATLQTPYFVIEDLSIVGNGNLDHDGIRITQLARFVLQRVSIFLCDTALDNVGSLVFTAYNLTMGSNNIGYKCRKSTSYEPNLVQFFSSQVQSSTTFGIDIGDADQVSFLGCDFEHNGTTADTGTGAVIIRDTIDDDAATPNITFTNCWWENNKGLAIKVEAATNGTVHFKDCHMYSLTADSNKMDVGAIKLLQLNNYHANGHTPTVTSAATSTIIIGGLGTASYVDNSTTTYIGSSIYSKSISATGVVTDTGQVGSFSFLSASPGVASVGGYNYDSAKKEPLNLFCTHVQFPKNTTAELNAIGNLVNTDPGKVQGAMVFDTTANIPMYATGAQDNSTWVGEKAGSTVTLTPA